MRLIGASGHDLPRQRRLRFLYTVVCCVGSRLACDFVAQAASSAYMKAPLLLSATWMFAVWLRCI